MSVPSLRPLGFGEILDGAFSLYRKRFGALFLTALLPTLPLALLWLLVFPVAMGGDSDTASVAVGAATVITAPLGFALSVLIWAALIDMMEGIYYRREVSIKESLTMGLRRFFPLFGGWIVASILMGLSALLLLLPFFYVAPGFALLVPAIVLERQGLFAGLGRSWRLMDGARLKGWGLIIIVTLIVMIPGMVLGAFLGVGFMGAGMMDPEAVQSFSASYAALSNLAQFVINALTTPFWVGMIFLFYLDRRVRVEGLDLEVATEGLDEGPGAGPMPGAPAPGL